MKKKLSLFQAFVLLICLTGCFLSDGNSTTSSTSSGSSTKKNSSFSIIFIDVGQGDSALIECDGKYMLIDGGTESAKDKVRMVLEEKGVRELEILALSHLHEDHIGGLGAKNGSALTVLSSIKNVIANSNSEYGEIEAYYKLRQYLTDFSCDIKVPNVGDTFSLGSATVEALQVASIRENDSLVLLITYGDTEFLFTGDILQYAQEDLIRSCKEKGYEIDVIKMPHHGDCKDLHTLREFLETFNVKNAVISVGPNIYGHPSAYTENLLSELKIQEYRTDLNGTITVKSDGEKITIEGNK